MNYLEPIDYNKPEFAQLYDELPIWSAPFGLLLLERVPLRRGNTILDVGAGTGFVSIELAQRSGFDSKIIAVDPWTEALDVLKHKVNYLQLPNITFLNGDGADIEIEDRAVDVIVSNLGINNFSNVNAVLKECHRVLKNEGDLLITTNLTGQMCEFYDVFDEVLRYFKLSEVVVTLKEHVEKRGSIESISDTFNRSGFKVVEVTKGTFNMKYVDGSAFLNHFFIRLGFLQDWKSLIPMKYVDDVFCEVENRLNIYSQKNDGLSLTIPYACIEAKKI